VRPIWPYDGNLGLGERGDERGAVAAAFDFDGFRASLLDEARGVGDGLLRGCVVGAEGHVRDEQSALHGAADGMGVVQHLVHGDGQGAVIAEDGHAERVADEEQVNAGLVDEGARGIVIRGERGDGLAGLLLERRSARSLFRGVL